MDIQLPQILFQAINFGVVMGALVFLLYKPVRKILDDRISRVAESQEAAEKVMEEKENIKSLKAKAKKDAQKEANKILEEAKKKADKSKQELVAKTKEALQDEMKKAQASWKEEKKRLIEENKKDMVKAVSKVAEMVIGQKLTSKADEKLIAESLKEVVKKI